MQTYNYVHRYAFVVAGKTNETQSCSLYAFTSLLFIILQKWNLLFILKLVSENYSETVMYLANGVFSRTN